MYTHGTIIRTRKTIKETLFRLYQIMAEPTLLYGCENSTEKNMKEMRQQTRIFEGQFQVVRDKAFIRG